MYLIFIDIDKKRGIEENLTFNGKAIPLEHMAKKTLIEQHLDDLDRAHMYYYSPIPVPGKKPDNMGIKHLKTNLIVWGWLKSKERNKSILRCQRCHHEWVYRGTNPFFTLCPHCRTTVRTTRNKNTILEIVDQANDVTSEVNKKTERVSLPK